MRLLCRRHADCVRYDRHTDHTDQGTGPGKGGSGKRANATTEQTPTFLYARKMTEWNLTNIIRSITDNDSFVITDNVITEDAPSGTVSLNDKFEFCIHGYYFCIDSTPSNNQDNTTIF